MKISLIDINGNEVSSIQCDSIRKARKHFSCRFFGKYTMRWTSGLFDIAEMKVNLNLINSGAN